MPSLDVLLLFMVVFLALAFDFINGFHDTANAIATSVSTRALTPRTAIIISAMMNFLGALTSTAVAKTIGKGIVDANLITQEVLIGALLGAIFWNLLTWYLGIPSSSSHAIIGGVVGAVVVAKGFSSLNYAGLFKILTSLIITPIISLAVGYGIMISLLWLFGRLSPAKINSRFLKLQVFAAVAASFSHGSNDAQKSMGIIAMALLSAGAIPSLEIPFWVMIACATAMALGTSIGGWKIIKTMGGRIVKLEPINGFAADLTSSLVIYGSTIFGSPVSTTHVVSSSIMGVGTAKRFSAVRWGVARSIITAWVLTIPATAFVAGITYLVVSYVL